MSRNLMSITDLSGEEIVAIAGGDRPSAVPDRGGIMALLFQQASLRTMASFAIAGERLGMSPITISTTGGALRDQTDVTDEIRQLSLIGPRCIVVRSAHSFADDLHAGSPVPIINAGDGSNEHPTQALVDIAALVSARLERKRVVIMGNLRDHRTTHSLALGLSRLAVDVVAVSPGDMALPEPFRRAGVQSVCAETAAEVDETLCAADAVYMVPLSYYSSLNSDAQGIYALDRARAERVLKRGARILHPFPRFQELSPDLDGTSFDLYHTQTALGPQVRLRVLSMLLN